MWSGKKEDIIMDFRASYIHASLYKHLCGMEERGWGWVRDWCWIGFMQGEGDITSSKEEVASPTFRHFDMMEIAWMQIGALCFFFKF